MKTASFFETTGAGRVQISRGTPRGYAGGYRAFRKLAPGAWFRSVTAADYVSLYRSEVLDELEPQRTWVDLHTLAGDAEPVILCFERAPFHIKNWCHRRLVAEWFQRELGVTVPELGGDNRPMAEILGFDPWA